MDDHPVWRVWLSAGWALLSVLGSIGLMVVAVISGWAALRNQEIDTKQAFICIMSLLFIIALKE